MHGLKKCIGSVIFCIFFACAKTFAADTSLSFNRHGKFVKNFSLDVLKEALNLQDIKVMEPHESREVIYVGFDVKSLLDLVYGDGWQNQEEILFTCVDGYQPSIPVSRFLKFKSYIVFERKGQKNFTVQNHGQNEPKVELGPFYLVWDNLNSEELRDLGANGWPYQVNKIDLVSFVEKFPKISPPAKSNESVRRGFIVFRDHCLSCHTINGNGGSKAPELNFPVNVTEYFSKRWLNQWIMEPTKIRFSTTMPGFGHLKNADQKIKDVVAYIEAMKNKKIPPEPGRNMLK